MLRHDAFQDLRRLREAAQPMASAKQGDLTVDDFSLISQPWIYWGKNGMILLDLKLSVLNYDSGTISLDNLTDYRTTTSERELEKSEVHFIFCEYILMFLPCLIAYSLR
jgi:hypothetical protein